MKSVDIYDITEAFRCLDRDCEGYLSTELVQTLFLGLGYQPPGISVEELEKCLDILLLRSAAADTAVASVPANSNQTNTAAAAAADRWWSLEQVLQVLGKVRSVCVISPSVSL